MKNFLDLLATKACLIVTVNGQEHRVDLCDTLKFDANDSVTVDGIDILPRYRHLANNQVLEISEPFYQWLHRVSGQGWLLVPR